MLTAAARPASAQAPFASVSGTIRDSSDAVIAGARVVLVQDATGVRRNTSTGGNGRFRFEHLAPGSYDIETSHPGFRTELTRVALSVGDHPQIDVRLAISGRAEHAEVTAQTAGINTTSAAVAGVVRRPQIADLPLNGRSFLSLAQLQPGVGVVSSTNPGALGNNYNRVLLGGAYYSQGRITVDGSTIGDRFMGGAMQGFSQESVEEFQVATFNLDIATGIGAAGAINIVTRRGSNQFRGTAFAYYRDDALAAYPGFRRDVQNPSPEFSRVQAGGSAGGPVIRDRLFWFGNYERNDQDAVFAVTNNHPVFSKFDGAYPNPLTADQGNLRLDARFSERHQGSLRASVEANDTLAPAVAVGLPSNWQAVHNDARQIQAAVVSVLTPRAVNDLRLAVNSLDGDLNPVGPDDCNLALGCIAAGGPNILVFDAPQFRIGNQFNSPFARRQRTFQIVDTLTWHRGAHRVRVGGEWEHASQKASLAFDEPAQIVLWGPTNLQSPASAALYAALPASLKDPGAAAPTLGDILQLPLRSFTTGIGDPRLPGPYNEDNASRNDRFRAFVHDTWQVRRDLTLGYGLAYSLETNLFAHDLDYPAYLAALVGDDLRPVGRDVNNFDPSVALTWSPGGNGRTVIRGGAGIYRDETTFGWKARDRAFIGPSGNGRTVVDGSLTGYNFPSAPTAFTGHDLLPLLPGLRADLNSRLGDGSDLSVRGVELLKQGDQIVAPDATTGYAVHATAGIQRELAANLVLTADFVMRRFVHVGPLQGVFSIDRNRFNRPKVTGIDPDTGVVSFVRDPVIPLCTPQQAFSLNPADYCSTGPINIFSSGASYRYQGLHVTLDKRYSSGWQFSAGYAWSRHRGFVDGGFTDFDDYSLAYGNQPDHRRHRLTLSGAWTPPEYRGPSRLGRALLNSWTVSFISQTFSPPPLNTLLAGLDLDGDGISLTLLPGTRHNSLGHELGASELRQLVDDYNGGVEAATRRIPNPDGSTTVVRPRTPFNQPISPIALPERFSNGDSFITQDVRLTRRIALGRNLQLALVVEVFNVFNIANLTGYSGVLNQPGYGQPSARVGQVFGTGGPRAFQFATRVEF